MDKGRIPHADIYFVRFEVPTAVTAKIFFYEMWHCVVWQIGTDVAEKPTASIFRVEDASLVKIKTSGACLNITRRHIPE
jgi:hypothetical protein